MVCTLDTRKLLAPELEEYGGKIESLKLFDLAKSRGVIDFTAFLRQIFCDKFHMAQRHFH